MTTRMPCSRCAMTRDIEVVEREEKVTIKGREIAFIARFSRCTTCGEEFETPEQLNANLDAARQKAILSGLRAGSSSLSSVSTPPQ